MYPPILPCNQSAIYFGCFALSKVTQNRKKKKKKAGNGRAQLLQFREAIQSVQNDTLILTQCSKQLNHKNVDTIPNR